MEKSPKQKDQRAGHIGKPENEGYSEEELYDQKKLITQVLKTGTAEEILTLAAAENDPDLHPQIKELIAICRSNVISGTARIDIQAKKPPKIKKICQ